MLNIMASNKSLLEQKSLVAEQIIKSNPKPIKKK
jgi:hypothetical protein